MRAKLEEKLQEFDCDGAEGASEEAVQNVEKFFGKELPEDLRELLAASNGIVLRSDAHEFQLWSCQEIIDYNKANEVQKHLPEFLMVGSNGSGETFTLDYRKNPPGVVLLPAIGFDYKSAVPVADDFWKLLLRLQIEKPLL